MHANNYVMDQAPLRPVLLLLNLVGKLRWESEITRAPPTCAPPPGIRQLLLQDSLSLGGLCGNPGLGMGLRKL